jgi:hypothetical protein
LKCLFPVEVSELCPEAVLKVQSHVIRLPYLGGSAIFGIVVGVSGAIFFGCRHFTAQCYEVYLIVSYATFGAMNLCGLFIHCIWEAPDPSYPITTPVLWALDCFFTGVSATSLGFASVDRLLSSNSSKRWLYYTFMLLQAVGSIFLLDFLVLGETTILLELWYLLPPIPVGWIILFDASVESLNMKKGQSNVIQQISKLPQTIWIRSKQEWCFAIYLLGFMVSCGGVIFDVPACYLIGVKSHLLDLPTATTCLFLGCDLAFAGLLVVWYHRNDSFAEKRKIMFNVDSKKSN